MDQFNQLRDESTRDGVFDFLTQLARAENPLRIKGVDQFKADRSGQTWGVRQGDYRSFCSKGGDGALDAARQKAEVIGLDMTAKNLKRRIEEHRKFTGNKFPASETRTLLASLHRLKPSWDIPGPTVNTKQTPAPLTDIYHLDLDTDQGPWLEWLYDAASVKRFITVMHLCDIHVPFQFDPALEVTYQMIEHVQPNLIVVGSDAADFSLISSFDVDADLDEMTSDVLDEFEGHWNKLIARVQAAAPNAMLVFIWGNHERRILRYLNDQAPKFRKRLLRDFIEIIRCGGAVAYIGNTDYVRVGPLVVHHGNRVGFSAAKNTLLDAGGQVSLMGGHVHYPSEYEIRGEDHTVKRIVSGCLCGYPHYRDGERMTKPWALAWEEPNHPCEPGRWTPAEPNHLDEIEAGVAQSAAHARRQSPAAARENRLLPVVPASRVPAGDEAVPALTVPDSTLETGSKRQ